MDKVIIVILTYNLEKYISQTLDSVLNQKTTYPYKILVGDDCSTDNTPEILKEYQQKYPDKIEIRLSDKNLGCLGNGNRLFDGLQSEYFSLLDGDDIWLDDEHLQKQIDFLENHKEYTIVAANTQYLKNDKPADLLIDKKFLGKTFTFDDFVEDRCPYFHPSTTIFRNIIYKNGLPACYKDAENTFENCALRGDDFRRIQHLQEGKVYIMPEVLSYYRIHDTGIWQSASENKRKIEGAIEYNFLRKYYKDTKYFDAINKEFANFYSEMMRHLIVNSNFVNNFSLTIKETNLLTGLLSDLADKQIPFNCQLDMKINVQKRKMSILKRLIRKINTILHH